MKVFRENSFIPAAYKYKRKTEKMDNEKPTNTWKCQKCERIVERYRGMSDVTCECGAEYNASGQRLRDDWRENPAWCYDDIDDMEGFEIQQLEKESREYD